MKMTAVMLLFVFTCQLLYPLRALALTTGPSQPEVQGFEPVGTTDMVDMFSGAFVYNIPLLDVEGYPVNISYHGGVSMEQEASWVGLGWNINPGTINRTIRGVPDDFNGDSLLKDVSIKDEKTLRVGMGVGVELFGDGDPTDGADAQSVGDPAPGTSTTEESSGSNLSLSISLGANINISNYRGVSCDFDLGGGINVMGVASAGVNVGVGSQTGASIDYNAGLSMSSSQTISKDMSGGLGLNVGIGGGYSTRSGIKDLDLSYGGSMSGSKGGSGFGGGFSNSGTIPIGVKNYVPVITNSSTMNTINGRIKLGGEVFGVYLNGNINAMFSRLHYSNDASRNAYGYMYLQNASIDNSSILDFTRDKDGMFNKSMQYLPPPNMTYDIYNVSGQGTGGMFRPFRNDFGNVYDPYTTSSSSSYGGEAEAGLGDAFEAGWDYRHSGTEITSGPWGDYQRSGTVSKGFTSTSPGNVYENVYFKQAGELTAVDPNYYTSIGNTGPITPDVVMNLPQTKSGSVSKRDPRANLIYYHTAKEDTVAGVGTNPKIVSYTANAFTGSGTTASPQNINRIGTGNYQRKKDQISEIVQVQKDGRKYVYGIPAMNNVQREVTFTVDPNSSTNHVNLSDGIVGFSGTDASSGNTKGRDNYYNSTVTPSYAHSYLLTTVLSTDYVDVTGNGPSDDDLGSFTKFNYSRLDSDYRWIAPYTTNMDSAQYNPGFWSDPLDDKASFVCGSREQWNLHSIETKNFVAEFYTSRRQDALGITAAILNIPNGAIYNGIKSAESYSYELDSIKLYNKHDRYIHGTSAVPIKTVFFVYNYSLCPGVPNSSAGGKLTLQSIFFRYGNSEKSMISPYQFGYGSNPNYSLSSKDRWGGYKPNNSSFTNYEFPYVNQNDPSNNDYASAWSLNKINLPSGGVIQANYECNDYAFVQDKPVNEMFMVQGLGNSPAFVTSSQLYKDNNTPYLYAYFPRRTASELPALSFAQNYLGVNFQSNGPNCVYFNFNVGLTSSNNTFEQIKGYANVSDIGICSNNTAYGYIKFTPVSPTGGGANLNPITYTALNVGRYNLPQIIFPGSDPNESDLKAILAGLKESFNELTSIGKSPLVHMVKTGDGQNVNLAKSYVRLQSVGLCKKGGGQRVRSLTFIDQWQTLAGGTELNATYGKNYDYTINDPGYGKISSGVASYEPLIGGDENPLRQPVPYIGQSGSNWPPNDPVDLYQETPIGESLFPPAQVGYSNVTVTSIHANAGRSSQGVDKYQFYTAKDFPAQVIATSINTSSRHHFDFFSQQNLLKATQGYTLIFNDMHGKPKKVEHDVYNPTSQTLQPISYQVYNYRQSGNKLNNNVKCMVYNGTNMQVQYQQLGIEEDVTMDSRQKDEQTHSSTLNGNFNFFIIPFIIPIPCPIPLSFNWGNENHNEFQSAVVTKVVQQYGILDNVVSYNENALTTMQNEIYDPVSGQAVVTSTTNEFMDKEYTTNIPASWVYNGMSAAYNNILYTDTGNITVGFKHIGTLNISNTAPLVTGDQLSVSYTDAGGHQQHTTAWVMGILPQYNIDSTLVLTPDTTYTLDSVPVTHTHHVTVMHVTDSIYYKYCFSTTGYTMPIYDFPGTVAFTTGTYSGDTVNDWGERGTIILPDSCVYGACTVNATLFDFVAYIEGPLIGSTSVHMTGSFVGNSYGLYCCSYAVGHYGPVTLNFNPFSSGYKFYGTVPLNQTSGETYTVVNSPVYFPVFGNIPYDSTAITHYDTTYADSTYYTTADSTFSVRHIVNDTSYHHYSVKICSGLNVLPRFPYNTPGWDLGVTLHNVTIQVINSGRTNMLNENVETYTSMDYPVNSSNILNTSLANLINIKAKTYADSNTMILHRYITYADTVNPYAIGERGVWRLYSEYSYLTNRNYTSVSGRNSGLFGAASLFAPSVDFPPGTCMISPYNYLAPYYSDPNWHLNRTISKWSPYGKEIEDIDAVGNYSTALFGYNQELPVAVAANAKQGEILADGFEDYSLLQPIPNIINYKYSPFNNFTSTTLSGIPYYKYNLAPSGLPNIVEGISHTGIYSLHIPAISSAVFSFNVPINSNNYSGLLNYYNNYFYTDPLNPYIFSSANEYLPFELTPGNSYTLSYWINPSGLTSTSLTDYAIDATCGVSVGGVFEGTMIKKSNIIDGWQQVEVTFNVPVGAVTASLAVPSGGYIDDVRIYPVKANMKSFVYNPVNEKLMATLDENNFATMYEYDQEGNLVRVKKETTKGIMTVSESRSGNPKQ